MGFKRMKKIEELKNGQITVFSFSVSFFWEENQCWSDNWAKQLKASARMNMSHPCWKILHKQIVLENWRNDSGTNKDHDEVTKQRTIGFVVTGRWAKLLLRSNTELKHFVKKVTDRPYWSRDITWRNCFLLCSSKEALDADLTICLNKEAAAFQTTTPITDKLSYKSYTANWLVPFVFYFDIKTLTQPVEGSAFMQQNTKGVEINKLCGNCIVAIEQGSWEPAF